MTFEIKEHPTDPDNKVALQASLLLECRKARQHLQDVSVAQDVFVKMNEGGRHTALVQMAGRMVSQALEKWIDARETAKDNGVNVEDYFGA